MKNKYTLFMSVAIIALLVSLSPAIGMAKENDNDNGNNNEKSNIVHPLAPGKAKMALGKVKMPPGQIKKAQMNMFSQFRNWFSNRFGSQPISSVPWNEDNNNRRDNRISGAPVITGLKAPTVLSVGQTGTWEVKAHDPENGSLSYSVDWGDAGAITTNTLTQSAITQTNTFTHSYGSAGNYTVTFTITDSTNMTAKTTTTVHVGTSVVTPPIISNVVATSSAIHNGVVSWTTDKESSSLVWVSPTSPVNTLTTPNISRNGRERSHVVNIDGLTAGTTYYVVVGSRDANGNLSVSAQTSFTTLSTPPQANGAPVITGIAGTTTISVGSAGTWTVQAYDPENGALSYSVNWGDANILQSLYYSIVNPVTQTSTFTHVYGAPGTYTATFTVTDDSNHTVSSSILVNVTPVAADLTPPSITSVSDSISSTSATVAWTTDELSTSEVYYGTVDPVVPNASTTMNLSNSSLTASHSITIGGLATSTTYYFYVESADAANNIATSSQFKLTTLGTAVSI